MATTDGGNRAIELLRAVPWLVLRPSAFVDLLLLCSSAKPAVRLIVRDSGGVRELAKWCALAGLFWSADTDGYVSIGPSREIADRILEVDHRFEPHERELGIMLGYPPCCCDCIAEFGENMIDQRVSEAAGWQYSGKFRRIRSADYAAGISLISHIPCSAECRASLAVANKTVLFIFHHRQEALLHRLRVSPLLLACGRRTHG